jgi:hypothetical protein
MFGAGYQGFTPSAPYSLLSFSLRSKMDLSADYPEQLEAIKSKVECSKDFECQKEGSDVCSSVRAVGQLLECSEENAKYCRYSLSFGYSYFCKCPLNNYLHATSNIRSVDQGLRACDAPPKY